MDKDLKRRAVSKTYHKCRHCGARPGRGKKLWQFGRWTDGGMWGVGMIVWDKRTSDDAPDYPIPLAFCSLDHRRRYYMGIPACGCRPAKTHRDCHYCGRGWEPNVCGYCREVGIDGKCIPGTAARRCAKHRKAA